MIEINKYITIGRALNEWIDVMRHLKTEDVHLEKSRVLKDFAAKCGGMKRSLSLVTPKMAAEWVGYARIRWPKAAGRYCRHCSEFFEYARDCGYILRNPFSIVKIPTTAKQILREPFTHQEFRMLVDRAKNDGIRFLIQLGWYTGMAVSDCCTLKFKNVDFDNHMIIRNRKKTGSIATIPFEPGGELHQALLKMKEENWSGDPEDFVCRQICNFTSAKRLVAYHIRKCGIKKGKTFHSFRATLVTRLVNANVNTTTAMAITGHKSVEVFNAYATVGRPALVESMRKLRWENNPVTAGEEVMI